MIDIAQMYVQRLVGEKLPSDKYILSSLKGRRMWALLEGSLQFTKTPSPVKQLFPGIRAWESKTPITLATSAVGQLALF